MDMRNAILRQSLVAYLVLSFTVPGTFANPQPPKSEAKISGRPNIVFEENAGQFPAAVRYLARAGGSNIFLTNTEAVYVLPMENGPAAADVDRPTTRRAHALRMRFAADDRNVSTIPSNAVEQTTNYFIGSNEDVWRTNIANYRQLDITNVSDGIDIRWHALASGALQYDFIVSPGADSERAQLTFEGADSLEIDADGGLLIATPAGTIRQARPYTYQDDDNGQRVEIPSSFRIDDDAVRFNIGEYDRLRPLIIDPTVLINNLSYSTLMGSFGDDVANDIAVDTNGCTYITGRTTSPTYPTTAGTFDTTANGNEDVFVTKLNSSGTGIVFSTFLGGTFFDEGRGIRIDTTGNIYIAGAAATAFPTTAGSYDTTFNGGSDGFIAKLNPTGSSLLYSTFFGTSSIDYVEDLAIDALGNVYVAGRTSDTILDLPTTVGAFDETHNGIDDGFVAKFNDTGSSLVYSTFLGGSEIDTALNIEVNTSGEAFVAGVTTDSATDFPAVVGSYDTTHNGVTDFFVSKVNAAGSALIYSTFIGGPGIDNVTAMNIDAVGSVYVAGTVAPGYPTTPGVFDTTVAGSNEIGLSKLSPSGATLQYSTFVGGTGGENANDIAVDRFGNVTLVGTNFGGDYPTTAGAFDTTPNGGSEAILTTVNQNATALIVSTYIGGAGNELANAVAIDMNGNAYLAGQTSANATQYPTTPDAYQTFHGGALDAFVSKFGDLSIGGRVIDTAGNPLSNVMIAMSGQVSGNIMTGADGRFGFTDTVPGEPHSVTATRSGYTINPTIFNIASLANNRELIFVGTPGSPSGGAGGTLLFQNLSYNKSENGNTVTATISRTGIVSSQTPVTVDWATSNGSATAGQDYLTASGQLTFGPFETSKTITIQLLNDNTLEPRESFSITLTNPTNSADIEVGRDRTTVNVLDEDIKSGSLLISEFRQRGRLGANDEYVKLFNPNDFDVTINTADGSSGITLAKANGDNVTSIVTIPHLVTIRSRGHYLITNNSPSGGFSLIDFPTGIGTTTSAGDQVFSTDIPDNSGIVLLNTSNQLQFTPANSVDGIDFGASQWSEGTGLIPLNSANYESCFVRRLTTDGLRDTGDNRSDFLLLDNHSRVFAAQDETKVYSTLGTPAPETSESLRMMLANEVSISDTGTEVYDPTPLPNGVQGTLTIFRRITNLTDTPITALRLRAIDFPTAGSSLQTRTASRPDFRLLSSVDSGGSLGLTLEGERLQPNGGGVNSTLSVSSVNAATPLLPGQFVVVAVRFGVMRWGRHPFLAAVEASN